MPVHTLDSMRRREENERRNQQQYSNYSMSHSSSSKPINRWTSKHKLIYAMIGINCMTFVGWQLYPEVMWKHFLLSNRNIQRERYYVLLTAAFSHQEIVHLAFNMYSLYNNGLAILDRMTSEKFLILYCGSGIWLVSHH